MLFKEKFSAKCDVFSFGVVLFEIFSKGKTPWAGMTNDDVIRELQNGGRMPLPPDFGPQFIKDIMEECWKDDPHQRPTFKDLLARFQVHVGISHQRSEDEDLMQPYAFDPISNPEYENPSTSSEQNATQNSYESVELQ